MTSNLTPRDCEKSCSSKVGKEKTGCLAGLCYQPRWFYTYSSKICL